MENRYYNINEIDIDTIDGSISIDEIFNIVEWDTNYTACIKKPNGEIVFEQKETEFPVAWSDNARNIVASKYFFGRGENRERSLKQLISRICNKIADEGFNRSYFDSENDKNLFRNRLAFILLTQKAFFNTPVNFSIGVEGKRQVASACYILGIEDNLESILDNAKTEGLIFKDGSGCGVNLSSLRGSNEFIGDSSGTSSGPCSFDQIYDTVAKITKSGGSQRRAARMVILNDNHPDIETFITCKSKEEAKAKALIGAGYDSAPGGEAYLSVAYQNANYTVRVSDEFLNAVKNDGDWDLINVRDGKVAKTLKAKYLWNLICKSAWESGDPGIQFDSTIQKWHTLPNSGRITGSNPCSEFLHLDFSSCNLASINLLNYFDQKNNVFKITSYIRTIEMLTIAMNILLDFVEFPTKKIEEVTKKCRPIGIGFANLGGLLMSFGIPYDSDKGRCIAQKLMSTITATAYLKSARLAKKLNREFEYLKDNKQEMLKVIFMHSTSPKSTYFKHDIVTSLARASTLGYVEAHKIGVFMNSQVSVLAPTGTIGIAMDCDTTGCEPELALVKYKWLVGGGTQTYVNSCVESALKQLGYNEKTIEQILAYISDNGNIENCKLLNKEHLEVFDTSFKNKNGTRFIDPTGHIRMLGALAPFISGSASKTVNLPESATEEDISNIYMLAHHLGVKCVAVYRDNCKASQPMSTDIKESKNLGNDKNDIYPNGKNFWNKQNTNFVPPVTKNKAALNNEERAKNSRYRLKDTRNSITHKFTIGSQEGYITVGLYDDGSPGEIFVVMSKQGSFAQGVMDSLATMMSLSLQYGVPLESIISKLKGTSYEPSGITRNKDFRIASSITDYIGKFLEKNFVDKKNTTQNDKDKHNEEIHKISFEPSKDLKFTTTRIEKKEESNETLNTGQICTNCGFMKVLMNKCFRCINCGEGGECGG